MATGPQKSYLESLFNRRVKEPLRALKESPFKKGVAEPLRGLLSAYLFPLAGFKRVGTGLLLYLILYPATTLYLPDGEDYLDQHGVDPAIAEELSNTTVRVRQKDNQVDRIHDIFNLPTIFAVLNAYVARDVPIDAHANPLWTNILGSYGTCPVMAPSEKETAMDFAVFLTDLPEKLIENTGMSQRAWFLYATFHEFAHCHTVNSGSVVVREADADWRSYLALRRVVDEPDLFKAIIYQRSIEFGGSHDTALYLDAMKAGRTPPTNDEIDLARKVLLYKLSNFDLGDREDDRHFVAVTNAFRTILKDPDLLPLVKRRAELYIEAAEFFAPSSVCIPPVPTQTKATAAPAVS